MQQFTTWLDADTEATLEDELDQLEDNQEFLEQFYAFSQLLDAINETDDIALAS